MNASDLAEAEQQQDISPLKISVDGAQDDGNEWRDELDSPWHMGDPPRLKTQTPSEGREEGARPQQKQDDVPNVVRPFEPEASIYSFQ